MSRIMHNELFRADALMQRTMMRALAPEHPAKEVGGNHEKASLGALRSAFLFSPASLFIKLSQLNKIELLARLKRENCHAAIDYLVLNEFAFLLRESVGYPRNEE